MLDLLLIHPPITDFSKNRIFKEYKYQMQTEPPLGLCYIAGMIEKYNYKVRILDMDLFKLSYLDLIEYLKKYQPKIVGIGANSVTYDIALRLAEAIKEHNKEINLIFGGVHPTLFYNEVIQEPNIDVVVRGEGEYTTLELVQYFIDGKGNLENITGIVYKNKEHKIKINPERPLEMDLDKLPFPARHLILNHAETKYFSAISKEFNIMSIMTSRGCPFKCTFCTRYLDFARFRSPKNIIEEINLIKEKEKINDIQIMDSTFNLRKKNNIALCKGIKYESLDIKWRARCRPDLIDKELAYNYKKAGCYAITYGAESGSDRILKFLKKGYTTSQVKDAFKITNSADIETHALFMIGIPGETTDDIGKSIKFMKEISPNFLQISIYYPFPGTELYDWVMKHKLYGEPKIFHDVVRTRIPVLNLKNLSEHDIQKLYRFAFFTFYISPGFLFKFGRTLIKEPTRYPRKLFQLLSYFVK